MSIVQNNVPPRLIAPGQQLSIPFLGQEGDKPAHRPKDLPRRPSPAAARRGWRARRLRPFPVSIAAAFSQIAEEPGGGQSEVTGFEVIPHVDRLEWKRRRFEKRSTDRRLASSIRANECYGKHANLLIEV